MRYSGRQLSALRTGVVLAFVVGMFGILGLLYVKFGGAVPAVTGTGYKISAPFTDIQNLVTNSDVEMAGVPIGKVQRLARDGDHVVATMVLHQNAPVHQGVTMQIRPKTLLNETYIQVFDGNGPAMPTNATLTKASVQSQTTFNDIINTFDAPTRDATGVLISQLQASTAGQGDNLNQILGSLGDVGRNGYTVYDILSSQSNDLQQLVKQTATLVGVLDEGQGQIGQLVTSAQQVNQTTANASSAVSATIRGLPGLMESIRTASPSVQLLSTTLQPIANNLQASAVNLNYDLIHLPPLTRQLDGLLPTLQTTLQSAPATLVPVRTTATEINQLLPSLAYTLSDLDPMVAYLAPYRRDAASFFSNFGAATAHQDCATCKTYTVAETLFNANSVESTTLQPGVSVNADPLPNQINATGTAPQPPPPNYTRVQRLKY